MPPLYAYYQFLMESLKKIFFFIHHYNELDHRTPIIYKWATETDIPAEIVLCSNPGLKSDYRIQYLSQFDTLKIYHVDDLFSDTDSGTDSKRIPDILTSFLTYAERIGRKLPDKLPKEALWKRIGGESMKAERVCKKLIKRIKKHDQAVIVCDWSFNLITDQIIDEIGEDVPALSFPHGDSPFKNVIYIEKGLANLLPRASRNDDGMVTGNHFNDEVYDRETFCEYVTEPKADLDDLFYEYTQPSRKKYNKYDYVIAPNHITAKRWKPSISDDIIQVLGSPRYNHEWISILSEISPSYDRQSDPKQINVVFFLRDPNYFVSTKQIHTTIEIVSQFSSINLVVKEHTSGEIISRDGKITALPNVEVVSDEVHSVSLIDWADVFLDIASSVVFGAIQRNKPVLSLEYTHANTSLVGHKLPNTAVHSYDQLFETLYSIECIDGYSTYTSEERNEFLNEMVGPKTDDILGNYVELINTQLNT